MSNDFPTKTQEMPDHVAAAMDAIILPTVAASKDDPDDPHAGDPRPRLVHQVIELEINPGFAPIFDLDVVAPAIPIHVYAIVKKAKVVGSPHMLVPRIVFETYKGAETQKCRVVLVGFGDVMPPDDTADHHRIGTFIHPESGMPITAYVLGIPEPKTTTIADGAMVSAADFAAGTPEPTP